VYAYDEAASHLEIFQFHVDWGLPVVRYRTYALTLKTCVTPFVIKENARVCTYYSTFDSAGDNF